jgi:hypothetical protein
MMRAKCFGILVEGIPGRDAKDLVIARDRKGRTLPRDKHGSGMGKREGKILPRINADQRGSGMGQEG